MTFYVYDDCDHAYDDHNHACAHHFDSAHSREHVNDHVYVGEYVSAHGVQAEEVVAKDKLGQKVMEVKVGLVMLEDMNKLDLQGLIGNYKEGEG